LECIRGSFVFLSPRQAKEHGLLNDFDAFEFHANVAAGITAAGYTIPTPIQAQAIPTVLEGRDVTGLAQTGTGKTAAFVLPILNRLIRGTRGTLRALIVAPTRELAEQINQAVNSLGRRTGLQSATAYGGVNIRPQIKRFKRGIDILVACPGRLLDHVERRTVDLSRIEVLVLDEADHMFDMGFLPDIRRIIAKVPQQRQTLLFSATMPREIARLANETLTSPITVKVGRTAPAETVSHALYPVAPHMKTEMLKKLLHRTDGGSVLVFTRTKRRAKQLGDKLAKAGYRAASIQGNLSQNKRQAALDGFRNGTFQILVATDIAARGIDVTQISHVINFDIPDTADAYIHRIGRTGRAACTGDAFTLSTNEDHAMVRSIERLLGGSLERRKLDDFNYDAPVPQQGVKRTRPSRPARPARPAHRKEAPADTADSKKYKSGWARKKPARKQSSNPAAKRASKQRSKKPAGARAGSRRVA
jgi:ATP-dependent RNA helicase RhlE